MRAGMPLAAMSASRIAFFATAATVLPILVLAIALQFRAGNVFLGSTRDYFSPAARAVVVVLAWLSLSFLFAAELAAASALYYDHDGNAEWVLVALLLGAVLFLFGSVDAVMAQMRK